MIYHYSNRLKIFAFVSDIVGSKHSSLFCCLHSRIRWKISILFSNTKQRPSSVSGCCLSNLGYRFMSRSFLFLVSGLLTFMLLLKAQH